MLDTLSVSQAHLDSTMTALQRGDYKTAAIWAGVIVVGIVVAVVAKKTGFTIRSK